MQWKYRSAGLVLCFLLALFSWVKESEHPVTLIVELDQWLRLEPSSRFPLNESGVMVAVRSQSELNYIADLQVPEDQILVLIDSSVPDWLRPDHWVLPARVQHRKIHANQYLRRLNEARNLAYEILAWQELTPADLFGSRFYWVQRAHDWERENLSQDALIKRYIRAVRERAIRLIYLDLDVLGADGYYKVREIMGAVRLLGQQPIPLPHEGYMLQILLGALVLVFLGYKLHSAFWLPLLFLIYEFPLSIQLQGFVVLILANVWLVTRLVLPKLKPNATVMNCIGLNLRLLLWLILAGSTYYALMDSVWFEQRIFLPRGTKIGLLLPAALVFLFLLIEFRFLTQQKISWNTNLFTRVIVFTVPIVLVLAFMVIRSGNQEFIPPTQMELNIRALLEEWLIARPRTRELLFWIIPPTLIACLGINHMTRIACACIYALLIASVFNTFSHFHTPYWLATSRVCVAFGLAHLVLACCYLLWTRWNKRQGQVHLGYFGFGNLGDDLLQLAIAKGQPEAKFLVGPLPLSQISASRQIPRRSMSTVIATLSQSRDFVLGPGGVLQDSSSRLSLWYYLMFGILARVLGCRLRLEGLGMSPLRHIDSCVLLRLFLKLVHKAEVRDTESADVLRRAGYAGELLVEQDKAFSLPLQGGQSDRALGVVLVLRTVKGVDTLAILHLLRQVVRDRNLPLCLLLLEQDTKFVNLLNNAFPDLPCQTYEDNLYEILELIARAQALISMRYHATLLAIRFQVPCLSLNYDAKCQNLASAYGLPQITQDELHKPGSQFVEQVITFLDQATNRPDGSYRK